MKKIIGSMLILLVLIGAFAPAFHVSAAEETKTAFKVAIDSLSCSIFSSDPIEGCLRSLAYILFFSIPSGIMAIMAFLFNSILGLTLSTVLYTGFIDGAWTVVRDISNIFFIIILLYIAIQMILGLGGHDQKKMIVWVIIMALLINFSMFFTKVVIDTSNIVALLFYNKISVAQKPNAPKYVPIMNSATTGVEEKDIAGNIAAAFNITASMDEKMLNQQIPYNGTSIAVSESTSLMITILIVTGAILLIASYAFFIAGFSFMGRLIELWILIIFSPFAFMSFPVPQLKSIDGIGWSKWAPRLIETAFMAPIFMFFMYLIAKISQTNFITGLQNNTGFLSMLLMIIIPSMIYIILLLKATEYAKKGGGQLGSLVMSGAKIVGGLAVGGAALTAFGAAAAGRQGSKVLAGYSRSEDAMHYGKARSDWELHGKQGSFSDHWEKYKKDNPEAANAKTNIKTIIGGRINASQKTSGEIDHARHEIDSLKKKLGLEGIDDSRLSGVEAEKLKSTFTKDNQSDIEKEIRRGYDAKGAIPINKNGVVDAKGESEYKEQRRKILTAETGQDIDNIDPSTGDLSDTAKKGIEDKLNSEFNSILKDLAKKRGDEKFVKLKEEAEQKVGIINRVGAKATTGSYDVRNIANIATDKREGIPRMFGVGLIAIIAAGMKLGMKKATGFDAGMSKGNILGDLGQLINEALKNMKVDVKLSDLGGGGGGGHASAKAHAPDKGGHDGGHGGGHGGGGHH